MTSQLGAKDPTVGLCLGPYGAYMELMFPMRKSTLQRGVGWEKARTDMLANDQPEGVRPPLGPRRSPTVGSRGGAVSSKRGNPAAGRVV